jgi:hypothetical protein
VQGLGACNGSESKWEEKLSGGPSMARGGAWCARASGRRRLLKPARGGEAVCDEQIRATDRHGLGMAWRRAATAVQWRMTVAFTGEWGFAAWRRPRACSRHVQGRRGRDAWTNGRGPASACVYGGVR